MGLIQVLHRDENIIAVNKPENLLVHRSRLARDHVVLLQLLRDQIGQEVFPVHRLDRPTSGVLLFALNSGTAKLLVEQFTERRIKKRYLAIVRGVTKESGSINYPLVPEAEYTNAENPPAQEAVTNFTRLAFTELDTEIAGRPARYSMVEARPQTGRTHQIRRHLAHLRHPIVGDTRHGDGRHNKFFRSEFQSFRLLLHAWTINFQHPKSGESMMLSAPLPEEFTKLCEKFDWDLPQT